MRRLLVLVALLQFAALLPFGLASPATAAAAASAEAFPTDAFKSTWARTDQPVRDSAAVRTWMWGPQPGTYGITEPYAEAEGGRRVVQYYDKSRMEITNIHGDPSSPWYVTNGLLVVELMTGDMQMGDNDFESRAPSINYVAGDMDAPSGITYATLADLRDAPPLAIGSTITSVLTPTSDTTADIGDNAAYASYGVTAAHLVDVPGIRHSVASPFWAFMNSSGTVWDGGGYVNASLFENPFYATGLPITEAYWTTAQVGGNPRLVLLQCFERRCLTFTPDNPAEWQVEAGNVGLHYKAWRYGETLPLDDGPSMVANQFAIQLRYAEDASERYAILLGLFDHLGIAVMDGSDGSLLTTQGRIRDNGDFYLYDAEVWLIAEAWDRHDRVDLSQLSAGISSLLLDNGFDLQAEFVRDALHAVALHAHEHPDTASAMPLLLIRQLGLAADVPYDIFSPYPLDIEAFQFDPIQQVLLLADVLLPLLDATLPLATFDPGAGCNTAWYDDGAPQVGLLGQHIAAEFGDAYVFTPSAMLSGFHALLLGKAIDITAHPASVHGNAGGMLEFQISVDIIANLSADDFQCGWLRADDLPNSGPLAGAAVHWLAFNLLNANGYAMCGEGCYVAAELPIVLTGTNAQGDSSLRVQLYGGSGGAHGLVLAGVSLGMPFHDAEGHLPGDFPVRWVPIPWSIS